MNDAQLRIELRDIRDTMGDDTALRVVVCRELATLASYVNIKPEFLLALTDEVVDRINEEKKKFRGGRDGPYPPANTNCMAIWLRMPVEGKAQHVEYTNKPVV